MKFVHYHYNHSKAINQIDINIQILITVNSYCSKYSAEFFQDPPKDRCSFFLYINDLSQVSRFDTTLFADDTLLMLSVKNLNNLENKVNYELNKIDYWLNKNKLSLNYTKTSYMSINKRPKISCIAEFRLQLNKTSLKREHTVKYLGIKSNTCIFS